MNIFFTVEPRPGENSLSLLGHNLGEGGWALHCYTGRYYRYVFLEIHLWSHSTYRRRRASIRSDRKIPT